MRYLSVWVIVLCLSTFGISAEPIAISPVTVSPIAVNVTTNETIVGDAKRGKRVFWQCRSCHYPEQGLPHNNGPSLWAIIGKPAGRQAGYRYSQAFQQVEFVWTEALMDLWLQDPTKFIPGNLMMSVGVSDPQQRADLIAYLLTFTEGE